MATMVTETVAITIEAPYERVSLDLADPSTHSTWATEFFAAPANQAEGHVWQVNVPRMGGDARMRIEADPQLGVIDIYLAPGSSPFGPPLPVRVIPNGDGCDVLFTLTRRPGQPDEEWEEGLASMRRELANLKRRFEG